MSEMTLCLGNKELYAVLLSQTSSASLLSSARGHFASDLSSIRPRSSLGSV